LQDPGGDVVEEEQRPRPLDQDVVHAVGHQVVAHRVVDAGLKRDLQLRAHAVGARHQHRLPLGARIQPEEPAEEAELAQHLRIERGAHQLPDPPLGLVAGVDVHAGRGVGKSVGIVHAVLTRSVCRRNGRRVLPL